MTSLPAMLGRGWELVSVTFVLGSETVEEVANTPRPASDFDFVSDWSLVTVPFAGGFDRAFDDPKCEDEVKNVVASPNGGVSVLFKLLFSSNFFPETMPLPVDKVANDFLEKGGDFCVDKSLAVSLLVPGLPRVVVKSSNGPKADDPLNEMFWLSFTSFDGLPNDPKGEGWVVELVRLSNSFVSDLPSASGVTVDLKGPNGENEEVDFESPTDGSGSVTISFEEGASSAIFSSVVVMLAACGGGSPNEPEAPGGDEVDLGNSAKEDTFAVDFVDLSNDPNGED